MTDFDVLFTKFENTKDVCKFYTDYAKGEESTRFLLIRSLDKPNLQDIVRKYSSEAPDSNLKNLTRQAHQTSITVADLITYIESKRSEIVDQRKAELEDA